MVRIAAQSASKISDFRLCPRLVYWQQVEKLKKPTHPAAALGTRIHKLVENYLLYSAVPTDDSLEARAAIASIPFLPPPPLPVDDVEAYFKELHLLDSGFFVNGRIDIVERAQHRITDLKTTSAEKWAKTEDQLLVDPQAILYALKFINAWSVVRFRLLYTKTRPPFNAWPVEVRMNASYVEDMVAKMIEQDLRPIHEILQADCASDVPHNAPGACKAYGGCFFQGKCEIANHRRVATVKPLPKTEDSEMTKKANPYGSVSEGTQTATPKPKASAPPLTPKKKPAPALTSENINPPGEAYTPESGEESAKPTLPKAPRSMKVDELRKHLVPYHENPKSLKKPELVALAETVFEIDPSQAAAAKPGAQTLNAPVQPTKKQIEQAVSDAVDQVNGGFVLCVDVMMEGMQFTPLESIVEPFELKAATESNDFERPNENYPDHVGTISYDKGYKLAAAQLHAHIPNLSGYVRVFSGMPGSKHYLAVLKNHASGFMKGTFL
jgi:hypothetical protein